MRFKICYKPGRLSEQAPDPFRVAYLGRHVLTHTLLRHKAPSGYVQTHAHAHHDVCPPAEPAAVICFSPYHFLSRAITRHGNLTPSLLA